MRKLLVIPIIAIALIANGCGGKDDPNVISASGTIESTDVNVAAKIPAQIVTLYIDDGTPVDSGSLIAHQDRSALDIQLRQAQAALDAARDIQTLTQKGARIEDIKQAEEAVQQAESNRQLATTELDRVKNLLAGGAATKDELDQTETKFKVAQSQLAQAEANAGKLKHFARPEELGEASAHTMQLQAAHDAIQKMIDDTYITSPLKGIVTHKVIEQGEVVAQGATVATVTDISTVYLMIYVTEEQLPRVKLGEQADVKIDGLPNKTFHGKVTYISPQAEFTPKDIQTKDDRVKLVFGVKVEIANPTGELKKGLPADATLHL